MRSLSVNNYSSNDRELQKPITQAQSLETQHLSGGPVTLPEPTWWMHMTPPAVVTYTHPSLRDQIDLLVNVPQAASKPDVRLRPHRFYK